MAGELAEKTPEGAGSRARLRPEEEAILELQSLAGNKATASAIEAWKHAQSEESAESCPISPEMAVRIDGARQRGTPLTAGTKAAVEHQVGADIPESRIHDSPEANSLAAALHARAFASGRDVFFRRGAYDPSSATGQALLAHELRHTKSAAEQGRTGLQRADEEDHEPSSNGRRDRTQNPLGAGMLDPKYAAANASQIETLLRRDTIEDATFQAIVGTIAATAAFDRQQYEAATPNLDQLLFHLKTHMVTRADLRSLWQDQTSSAYDTLWYLLPEELLPQFRQAVGSSRGQVTMGPELERPENAAEFMAPRATVSTVGVAKNVSMEPVELLDSVIALRWRALSDVDRAVLAALGMEDPDTPPQCADHVRSHFDQTAAIVSGWLDLSPEAGAGAYEDAEKWSKIPVALLWAAAGGGKKASSAKILFSAAEILQTVNDVADSSDKIGERIAQLQSQDPNVGWAKILADGRLTLEFAKILGCLLDLSSTAGEKLKDEAVEKAFEKFDLPIVFSKIDTILQELLVELGENVSQNPKKRDELTVDAAKDILGEILDAILDD